MTTTVTESSWTERDEASGLYVRKVYEFGECLGRTAKAVKMSGALDTGWDELEALVDTTRFRRIDGDGVAIDWPAYRAMLVTASAPAGFRKVFDRVSQAGNRVFMELTEYDRPAGEAERVVGLCTVYQFDAADRLVGMEIYTRGG